MIILPSVYSSVAVSEIFSTVNSHRILNISASGVVAPAVSQSWSVYLQMIDVLLPGRLAVKFTVRDEIN